MDFFFADKPGGVTTHLSEHETNRESARNGFVEYLSAREAGELFVSHRLDRDTTGAICFARTAKAAEILRALFAERAVKKRYLFLTDRKNSSERLTVTSHIERRGNSYISEPSSEALKANATTEFQRLEESDGLTLWAAEPESGKPHQIRLHAASEGLTILGDGEYGGTVFPALCLHSESLIFTYNGETFKHTAPPPCWFHNRKLTRNSLLCRWLVATDRRDRLLRSQPLSGDTLRWIHSEGAPLRAEQLGDIMWLSWYADSAPDEAELKLIRQLASERAWPHWYLQVRGKAGAEEALIPGSGEIPGRWTAKESHLNFEFRTDSGWAPGLFLDQRQNRLWLKKNATGKRVLNLFCYTGGFSLAAAAGGASTVVSVDTSKNFLEWAKGNFALNDLAIEGHEFRAMDSREYLAWARKKNLEFDIVVCDPPSFSRSKSGVFSIEQELDELLVSLLAVTKNGGRILFATNFEKWNEITLFERLEKTLSGGRLEHTPEADWDFEVPGEPRNMKSLFILKT